MFMPVLLLRYAGISKLFPSKLPFGQPGGEYLFTNKAMFSVPARVEVPEVMKRRRGLGVEKSRGMKVEVMICVPTVLMFQD